MLPAHLVTLGGSSFKYASIRNLVFADGCKVRELSDGFMRVEGGPAVPSTTAIQLAANSLETIDFGENNSLADIGCSAFRNQSHLTKIDFGTSTASLTIGEGAFIGAGNNAYLVEKKIDAALNKGIDTVVFPANLAELGKDGYGQTIFRFARIKNLVFSDNCKVKVIPDCFMRVEGENGMPGSNCSSVPQSVVYASCALETIDFGKNNSLTNIYNWAFYNQSHLTKIDFGTSTAGLTIGDGAFAGAGNNAYLVEKNIDSRLNEGIETMVFPANLVKFGCAGYESGNTCFRYARIKNLVFADGCQVKDIPDCFMRVEGKNGQPGSDGIQVSQSVVLASCALETIDFGENNSLTSIYNWAFYNQSHLTKIDFGTSDAKLAIGDGAFAGAGNNAYLVEIGEDAELSEGITNLVFPANLDKFGDSRVEGTNGQMAFRYARVKNITFADNCKLQVIPNCFMRVEGEDGKPGSEGIQVSKAVAYAASSLESIDFGKNNSLTTIDNYAFRNQSHLTKIDFGTSSAALKLCDGAFMGAGNNAYLVSQGVDKERSSGIDTLVLPANLTYIANLGFKYASVRNVVFSDNCQVTYIGDGFMEIGGTDGYPSSDVVYVAANCLESVDFGTNYKLASLGAAAFHNQSHLTKIDFGTAASDVTLTLHCGAFAGTATETLTLPAFIAFSGEGQFKKAKVQHLVFADNFPLTTLPDGFLTKDFNDAADQPVLESIDFGKNNSLTTIGAGMFAGNEKLKTLDLSGTKITTIEKGAFKNCGLQTIVLPNTLTKLSDGAFQGLTEKKTLYIGSGCKLTKLEGGVFSDCAKLETLNLLDSNITVIDDALKNNYKLKRIIFPKKLQSVTWSDTENTNVRPFNGCGSVNELYFAQEDPSTLTFTDGVFKSFGWSGTVYVPTGTSQEKMDAYKDKLTAAGLDFSNNRWKIQEVVSASELSVSSTELRMAIGEKKILTSTVLTESASCKEVLWSSSDSAIASVSDTGVIIAKSSGVVTITAKSMIGDASATCTVTVLGAYSCAAPVAASKTPQTLLLGGENVGEYLISGSKETGFTLQKDGKYLAISSGKVQLQTEAFTWEYNGGLYADVSLGRSGNSGFFRTTRYLRYYLAADANGQLYARLVYTKAMVLSSVITNVPPIRLTVEESVFRFMLFTRSSYVFTVENVPDGAKAEYSLGNTWTTGDTFSAASKPANVWIRVTEKDGTVTVWKATLTDGAYELNIVE